LLAMGLKKDEFIGTGAWFFLIVNSSKVPFFIHQGLITPASLRIDLLLLLGIPLGVLAGIWLVRRLSNRTYVIWVEIMTALAALRLLVG
ncbi:MAG: sulfite exporter TauE/SafE family protein, partial [Lentisphaerae bacterium]|nr:sulfite exporter TauE/SafE family protein [Lentisphaerota bacterium]